MYFGESVAKLDEKSRITVPRRTRDTMEVEGHAIWYMTRGYDKSIFLFHRDAWNEIRTLASKHPSMDGKSLDFRRYFFSGVTEVRPDPQGRMAVPQHLREYAGIDKEAVLIGVDDHLELWNREAWRAFQDTMGEGFKEMASALFSQREAAGAAT